MDFAKMREVVEGLVELETEKQLTTEDQEAVIAIVDKAGINGREFIYLDEKPGAFGYREDEGGWHWKLRQTRNRNRGLFEVLKRAS